MRMHVQSLLILSVHDWAARVKSQLLKLKVPLACSKLQTITAEVGVVNNVNYFYFLFFPRPTDPVQFLPMSKQIGMA